MHKQYSWFYFSHRCEHLPLIEHVEQSPFGSFSYPNWAQIEIISPLTEWFGLDMWLILFASLLPWYNQITMKVHLRELLPRKLTAGTYKSPFWFKECRHFPQALFVSHSRWAAPVRKHTPLHLSAHRQRLLKVLPTRHMRWRSGILSKFSWEMMLHRLFQSDASTEQSTFSFL